MTLQGECPYGTRCRFIHDELDIPVSFLPMPGSIDCSPGECMQGMLTVSRMPLNLVPANPTSDVLALSLALQHVQDGEARTATAKALAAIQKARSASALHAPSPTCTASPTVSVHDPLSPDPWHRGTSDPPPCFLYWPCKLILVSSKPGRRHTES
ncbi:MAG: hypothetical protein MHM6MM_007758 [Cercozoa sp. M6MM]